MQITMFTADCTGQAANCSYPNRRMVTTPEEMQEAVRFDHVCAEYKGNYPVSYTHLTLPTKA